MRVARRARNRAAIALLCSLPTIPGWATDAAFRVMLQGTSAPVIRDLVEDAGGTVTHFLPIIDAVGARVDGAQLETLRSAPAIERIIDDLDRETPAPEDPGCQVGAALELKRDGNAYDWVLFNKGDQATDLTRVELAWDRQLGALTGLSFLGRPLIEDALATGVDHAIDPAPGLALAPGSHAPLRLTFEHGEGEPAAQDTFSLDAAFGDECTVELIPGYRDPDGDSFYTTVAGADLLHRHGVTGKGVTVAVLDSGLWDDPRLILDTKGEPRVLASYDAIAGRAVAATFDESGHGSHMTSILAQSRPITRRGTAPGAYRGAAPDARLVIVKAFNREGQGDMLDIVRGVQWVLDHREKYGIRVMNLSFAARPRWPYWLDPINQAVLRAWEAGIVVVAAAGNEGPELMTVGSPGNLPYIITVGAVTDSWTVDDRTDDYLPDFSSRGPTPSAHIKPDLVAPGGHMAGITRPGSTLTTEFPEYLLDNGDFVMTGTSQAAALVSGLAALLLQVEPGLTPDDVKCMFMSTADPAINADGRLSYSPFLQGRGYISIQRALTLGQPGCGNEGLDIALDISGQSHFEGPAILGEDGIATLPGLDTMVGAEEPEKGASDNRRWGIKAHIERAMTADSARPTPPDPNLPFDWFELYTEEKARIEALSNGSERGRLR